VKAKGIIIRGVVRGFVVGDCVRIGNRNDFYKGGGFV
jgi:hypothetical protein